jgi:hypothetical protein
MKRSVRLHHINNSKQQGLHEVSCHFVAGVDISPAADVVVLHVAVSRLHRLEHTSFLLLPLPLHLAGRGTR